MKVIRVGTKPGDKLYRATCSECGTVFEFFEREGRVTHDQRDGSFVTVECPICGKNVHVDWKRKPD